MEIHLEKLHIISQITEIDDINVIQKIKKLLSTKPTDTDMEIPQWQQDIVLSRIKNAKKEDFIDSDEVIDRLREKIKL